MFVPTTEGLEPEHKVYLVESLGPLFECFLDREFVLHEEKQVAPAFPVSHGISKDVGVLGVLFLRLREALTHGGELLSGRLEAIRVVVVVLAELLKEVRPVEVVAKEVLITDREHVDALSINVEIWH